ncbi:MAG TPA: ATP-binding protein [Mycobacteriales bacterium]
MSSQDRIDPPSHDDRLAGTADPGMVPVEPAPAVRDPTTGPPEVLRELGNSPAVVSDARAMVTGALLAWGAPEPGIEDCVAVVSELVTNALIHAEPPVHLRLALASPPEGTVLRIEVSDGSSARPRPRPPTRDQPGGRGLLIVQALAHRYGVLTTAGGKTMWAEVLLRTANDAS